MLCSVIRWKGAMRVSTVSPVSSSSVSPPTQADQSPLCPLKEACFPLSHSCVHIGPFTKDAFSLPLTAWPNATDLSPATWVSPVGPPPWSHTLRAPGVYILHGNSIDFTMRSPKIQLWLHYVLVEWSWEVYLTFEKFNFSQKCHKDYKIIYAP